MGNWLLEVGKMALYMSFPVALFHYFNQPEYFEKYVIEKKREMYPIEDEKTKESLDRVIRMMREKEEKNELHALEAVEAKRKLKATQAL